MGLSLFLNTAYLPTHLHFNMPWRLFLNMFCMSSSAVHWAALSTTQVVCIWIILLAYCVVRKFTQLKLENCCEGLHINKYSFLGSSASKQGLVVCLKSFEHCDCSVKLPTFQLQKHEHFTTTKLWYCTGWRQDSSYDKNSYVCFRNSRPNITIYSCLFSYSMQNFVLIGRSSRNWCKRYWKWYFQVDEGQVFILNVILCITNFFYLLIFFKSYSNQSPLKLLYCMKKSPFGACLVLNYFLRC